MIKTKTTKIHCTTKYTWHSNTNPPTYSRLDYFFISSNIVNIISHCIISYGDKTTHSIVPMTRRRPFKINNSILLVNDYIQRIKNALKEIANINKEANPNTR